MIKLRRSVELFGEAVEAVGYTIRTGRLQKPPHDSPSIPQIDLPDPIYSLVKEFQSLVKMSSLEEALFQAAKVGALCTKAAETGKSSITIRDTGGAKIGTLYGEDRQDRLDNDD